MKTAISIPDELFHEVENRARRLGISSSEFFTRAVNEYLKATVMPNVTEQINAALDLADVTHHTFSDVVDAGRLRLIATEGEW